MPKSKSEKQSSFNYLKWGVIINFIMLVVVILGLLNISIPVPSFEKEEYTIQTLNEQISHFTLPSLETSPDYFVELTVNSKSEIDSGNPLKFSVKSNDYGKIHAEEPVYRILIVDALGNVRGVYPYQDFNSNQNISTNFFLFNDESNFEEVYIENMNFIFELPPEDQKIIGDWRVYIFLFNNYNEKLVSYNIFEFNVKEKSDENLLAMMLINLITVIITAFLLGQIIFISKKKWKSKEKKD